jgi:hypothetical protein
MKSTLMCFCENNITIKTVYDIVHKIHSLCFGTTGGHGNFAFNLVVKLCVELVCFSKFEVINSDNV